MSQGKPSHLAHLGATFSAGLVGSILTAVAGSIALVALALALNAALLVYIRPAWAAAATAAVFAAICGLLAIVTPKLIAGAEKPAPATLGSVLNPANLGLGIEIGLAIVEALAAASWRRRRIDRAADL